MTTSPTLFRSTWLATTTIYIVSLLTLSAQGELLYDASLQTYPERQGWAALSQPLIGRNSTQQVVDGILTLDTSENLNEQFGYFSQVPLLGISHPSVPHLDLQSTPFSLSFSLRVQTEHNVPDSDPRALGERNRGGFAVIAIGEQARGIELHFQEHRILTLDSTDESFPLGEQVEFDTTAQHQNYTLELHSHGYRLFADNRLLVIGSLRDYRAIAPDAPFDFPYTTPSFLFFGDDTPRAGAVTDIGWIDVRKLGDCDDDTVLDKADFVCISRPSERDSVLKAIGSPLGDLNADQEVGFADFLLLARNFGSSSGSYADGNLDLQDGITFNDFLLLSRAYGRSASAIAVPEPFSSIAVWLLWPAMRSTRRRR